MIPPFLQIDDSTAQILMYELGGIYAFLAGIVAYIGKLDRQLARVSQFLKDKLKADL